MTDQVKAYFSNPFFKNGRRRKHIRFEVLSPEGHWVRVTQKVYRALLDTRESAKR